MAGKQAPPSEEAGGLNLCEMGKTCVVPAGTRVVSQGETPEFFYIIQSGRLQVFRETADHIRTPLTELGPGAYFGEVALVTGQPRTASVESLEETSLVKVSKEEFDRLLDHNPQLARHIIEQLSSWLVSGDRRLEQEVVHQVKLRQISWFDYVLMLGLSLFLALVVNIYNDNGIPLIYGWGAKNPIPEIGLDQALEMYQKNEAIFVDARKSAFFSQEHIKGAMNLPVILFDLMNPMFQYMVAQTEGGKDKPFIVYGGSFSRRFDVDLARLLKGKGTRQVMVLRDYQGLAQGLSPGGETIPGNGQRAAGSAGLPRMAAGGHLPAHLDSSHPPQPLPFGGLPAAGGGYLYDLRPEQDYAAGGLRLECGGFWVDALLWGEPVVPGAAVGGAGGGNVSHPGYPHQGRGHPDRGHEPHLHRGSGPCHLSASAHQLRLCRGSGRTGDLVEGSQEYRGDGHDHPNFPLRSLPGIGSGRLHLAE